MAISIFPSPAWPRATLLRWAGSNPAVVSVGANFADWAAWPDRTVVILAELTPSKTLEDQVWTSVGSDTFSTPLPHFVYAIVVGEPGVEQRCVGVRQNDTDLIAAVSVAAVQAAAGSWYWDEAANTLYVHATTGASPATFTVIQAFVTFRFASTGIILERTPGQPASGSYYHPWITGELPRTVQQVEDLLFGAKLTETGSISFTNGHGFWHRAFADYWWKNRRVQVLVGGSYNGLTLTRSQYAVAATMLIEDLSPTETVCTLVLKPLQRTLDREVPVTPIFETEYPNLGDGVRGTKKWIGYGRATIVPDLTDTSSHGVYTVADATYQTLFAVHGVTAVAKTNGARTALTAGADYSVNLTACTVTILNASFAHANYTIEVDVTGKPDGSGSYLKTFAAIARDMLLTFADVKASDIDEDAFAQAAQDAPEELSVWLKSPRQMTSLLSTSQPGLPCLERSVMGTLQQTVGGLWTCWIWDPSYDAANITRLRKEDFRIFAPQPRLESMYAWTRVLYGYHPAKGEWSVVETSDERIRHLAESNEVLEIPTFLRNKADAETLAQRYEIIAAAVAIEVDIQENLARLALANVGDKVLVTFQPAPSSSGEWIDKPFEILRLEKAYAPTLAIAGRLGDLHGVANAVGRWMEDAAPDYDVATDDQKEQGGYWCDDDGLADPADPNSKDVSVWW
jgi:hypothetical protein